MDPYIASQEVLERISRHCPEALSVYLHCINRVDANNRVFFSRSMIDQDMSETFTKFRNKIKKLAVEDVLEWHPFNNGLMITLVDFNADE